MDQLIEKKIRRSNRIFPIFYGLSLDLIFFIAINTLFLTEVKGLTASEINLTTTVGVLVALVFYLLSHKIIKRIGNINSIKLGTFLILIAAILFTVSNNLILFALAEILYEVSFVFKCVDTVVLNNNLIYEKKDNEFIKIKSKATTIYSFATLFATAVGGFLFNINPYLPMIICIIICLNNFILAHFIYEVDIDNEKIEDKKKVKFNISKIVFLTMVVYGLLYGTVVVCQTNDKLFLQSRLQEFLSVNNVALIMSFVLFLSRISRLLSNIIFSRIYNKLKDKVLYILYFILFSSVLLFIFFFLFPSPLIGSIMMTFGFLILLTLRDPLDNLLSNILLKNVKKNNKEQAMLYFQFARRLTKFILSLLATIILAKYELLNLYIIIFICVILYIFIIFKLLGLIKDTDNIKE